MVSAVARRLSERAGAVAAGVLLDAVLGEPPVTCSPVARYGQAMQWFEDKWWADSRARGVAHATAGVGVAAAAASAASALTGPAAALAATTYLSSSAKGLLATAAEVGHLVHGGDLQGARSVLPALVGRDPAGLDETEIARAVVESVAENLSDALVATAWWGLVAGAAGAAAHRAGNTLDAMVGHRTSRLQRFGWASARVDDLLGWPAARVTALLVAFVSPARAGAVLSAVRRDAPKHPSPNAGVVETAFAGALGLRLGGTNVYQESVEVRPSLGTGRTPMPEDIWAAITLARRVTGALTLLLTVAFLVGRAAGPSKRTSRRTRP